MAIDPKVSAAFDLMIAGVENMERKGVTFPYIMLNGNLVAMITRHGTIGIVVDPGDWRQFEGAGGTPFEAVPGIPLKGYGQIPETMYRDRLQIQSWFRRAHAAAGKLPARSLDLPRKDVGPMIDPSSPDSFPRRPTDEDKPPAGR